MPRPLVAVLLVTAALAGCLSGSTGPDAADAGPATSAPAADDANVTFDWSAVDQAELRPGASLGGYCTFNWVYTSPNGTAYVGTAAHCTDGPGEELHLGDGDRGTGPMVGTVVFDSDNASEAPDVMDFTLVRLADGWIGRTHPAMIGWDGPTGVLTADDASTGDRIGVHGHGLVFHQTEATQDRPGVLTSMDEQTYEIQSPFIFGDSGGPVIHAETGRALGVVSGATFGVQVPPYTNVGPTVDFVLRTLHELGWDVEMATE